MSGSSCDSGGTYSARNRRPLEQEGSWMVITYQQEQLRTSTYQVVRLWLDKDQGRRRTLDAGLIQPIHMDEAYIQQWTSCRCSDDADLYVSNPNVNHFSHARQSSEYSTGLVAQLVITLPSEPMFVGLIHIWDQIYSHTSLCIHSFLPYLTLCHKQCYVLITKAWLKSSYAIVFDIT